MKPKILITGGAGFIGSHLVEGLVDDFDIVVLDNCLAGNKISPYYLSKIKFVEGDVRDYDTVFSSALDCEAIIHLAAVVGVDQVIDKRVETIEVEAQGAQNVGKVAMAQQINRIIYSSSSSVYKNTISDMSYESDALDLVNDYAVAKRLNELYFNALNKETDISTVSFRFFNVYGLNQDGRMVIPRFFNQAFRNEPIQVFGDGTQTRDFTYVDDVNYSIKQLLETPSISGIFNIARGKETTILDLARNIKAVTNSKSKIEMIDFPKKRASYKVERRIGSPDKLFQHTGFKPMIELSEGLHRYVEMMREKLVKAV